MLPFEVQCWVCRGERKKSLTITELTLNCMHLYSSSPQLSKHQFPGTLFFHRRGRRGWFGEDSTASHFFLRIFPLDFSVRVQVPKRIKCHHCSYRRRSSGSNARKGSSCKYSDASLAHLPLASCCAAVSNRPWTSSCPCPRGWGLLIDMLQDVAANGVAFSSVAPECFQRNDLQPTLASYLTSL